MPPPRYRSRRSASGGRASSLQNKSVAPVAPPFLRGRNAAATRFVRAGPETSEQARGTVPLVRFDARLRRAHARTQGELIKKKTMALAKEEQETEARRKREAREAMVSPVPAQMWAG